MRLISFFSYNITHCSTLYDCIISDFCKRTNSILFLQEKLKKDYPKKIKQKKLADVPVNSRNKPYNGLEIYVTKDLEKCCFSIDDYPNYQILNTKWGKFVNVHLHCKIKERDAETMNQKLTELIKANDNLKIVGGDFNNNPYDYTLYSRLKWNAKRNDLDRECEVKPDFINPFWRLLPQTEDSLVGTLKPSEDYGEGALRYPVFDQFLVSPDLFYDGVKIGVLQKMSGKIVEKLSEKEKQNNRLRGQFHWPVFMEINI